MTEISETRRVRASKPERLETETENPMISERKRLVPDMNGRDENSNMNTIQGFSPRP